MLCNVLFFCVAIVLFVFVLCLVYNNISVTYIGGENVVFGKNHRPAPCHCQTLSQNVVPSTPHYNRYLNTHGIALVTLRIFDSIHVRHTNKPVACMMY